MKEKKRWKDLPLWQKASTILAMIIQVSLLGAALLDIRHRPAEQIRGSKVLWTALAFVNYVGPIGYFLVGRKPTTGQLT